jgi:hypothetical protein
VISKKKIFIDFLDELGRKTDFYEKKTFRRSAVCRENFVRPILKDAFKLETSPFGSLKELV